MAIGPVRISRWGSDTVSACPAHSTVPYVTRANVVRALQQDDHLLFDGRRVGDKSRGRRTDRLNHKTGDIRWDVRSRRPRNRLCHPIDDRSSFGTTTVMWIVVTTRRMGRCAFASPLAGRARTFMQIAFDSLVSPVSPVGRSRLVCPMPQPTGPRDRCRLRAKLPLVRRHRSSKQPELLVAPRP
jgi:hypothetical protein